MLNGSRAQAPAAKLSAEDQQYLVGWQKKQPINTAMPDQVGVETSQVKAEVVSEDPVAEKFVYRTQHFEFESQGKFNQVLLRDVARKLRGHLRTAQGAPRGISIRGRRRAIISHAATPQEQGSLLRRGGHEEQWRHL